jgi:hypothetical protein
MKREYLLLIICFLSLESFFSCKKSAVYPPGTATVKYVITTTSPCRPLYSSIAYTTADSGKAENISNFGGTRWTNTVVVNTNKGNWYKGSTLLQMWLLGQFSFLKQSSVEASIYVNGALVEHQIYPAALRSDSTYSTGAQLIWSIQAPNPY